jgi:hypothetical protein
MSERLWRTMLRLCIEGRWDGLSDTRVQRRGATGDDHVVIASQWAALALTSPRASEGRMGIQRRRHAGRVVVSLVPSKVVNVFSIPARSRTEQIKLLTGHSEEQAKRLTDKEGGKEQMQSRWVACIYEYTT